MKQLEAVFLANVMLHLRSIETIIRLIHVNKKCQEATKIIRYYDKRKLCESDGEYYYNYIVVKNIFDIFPNIETIKCKVEDIINNIELIQKVNQIELYQAFCNEIKLPQEIKDKVIKLDVHCQSLRSIRLNEFPNVRNVQVSYFFDGNLKEFLGDSQIKLKSLVVKTGNFSELVYLKEYKNIEKKVIKMEKKMTKETYDKLKSFSYLCSEYPIDGIDIKETLCLHNYNQLTIMDGFNINEIYHLTLFTKCLISVDCDLRKCEFLEHILSWVLVHHNKSVQIEGLKHLKIIEFISKLDCIPSSVTKLSFNNSFNYKELLENDNKCFYNIKEVELEIDNDEIIEDTKVLLNFKNCARIKLHNKERQIIEFPVFTQELTIDNFQNEDQISEILKLTHLKKLEIDFKPNTNTQKIQEMFFNLKGLDCLKTNFVDGIYLPSTITHLELKLINNTDLSQYTHLKDITIIRYAGFVKKIQIPLKFNKLYVYGEVIVINSNEIDVDRIILSTTPSQKSVWKSKNIFIEKCYEENE